MKLERFPVSRRNVSDFRDRAKCPTGATVQIGERIGLETADRLARERLECLYRRTACAVIDGIFFLTGAETCTQLLHAAPPTRCLPSPVA